MKKAILIILVLFLANSIVAQTKTAIKLNAGLNVPSSTKYFSDYWSASYNFGGGIDIYLNSQLSLQGYIDYNHFPFDSETVLKKLGASTQTDIISGAAINILNLSANVKYHLIDIHQKVSPYILGGIGYVNLSLTDLVSTESFGASYKEGNVGAESVGALSINFGFGIEFMVSSGISIFVDARYVLGFTEGKVARFTSDNISNWDDKGTYSLKDNTKYIPLRAGISFSL